MAEAILSPLIDAAIGQLSSMIQAEVSMVCGVEQELEKLSRTMSAIKSVLVDAEEKQVRDLNIRNWLIKLKDAAYEVDNILDEYATDALRSKAKHTTGSRTMQVSNLLTCVNCFKKVAFRHNIGKNMKDVNRKLDEIAKDREIYNLRDVGVPEMNKLERPETDSFVDGSQVLGRKDEKEKIIKLLLSSLPSSSSSSSHDELGRRDDLSVISIVGFGGLGKTTLAQSVYNDENVKEHFQTCMWVCVSENFEIKSLVKMIIESVTKGKCEELRLDTLQENLREKLNGKRFLLVLDDVWNEDQIEWEGLIRLLRCGGEGSRMIVTTRSHKVSPTIIPNTTIDLVGLSENDWRLFKQWAFRGRNEEEHPELITIGHHIAKKCKGVPLTAKTIGGLMHYKRDASEWEVIRDSELWDFEEDGKDILNSLRISYNHLPSYLKQCFVYCSIFPKDYDFEKEKLIKLWMAQGFIPQPSAQSNRQMEDIGNDYFNGLLWRSFFQNVKRDDSGNIVGCKMHDHLHDLAQSIGKNDCFVKQVGRPKEVIASKVYHSSFAYDFQETPSIPEEMYELYKCRSYLRTLVVFGNYENDVPNDLFSKLRDLRVLDLSFCKITEIPDSIGNMIHLRYLNLSATDIQRLPETTCNLWNLQTLNINYCYHLSELPKGLKNMINLRHLEMEYSYFNIDCMPSGIGRLTCLQTLPIYIVGREKECGGLGELQDLLNLRGVLKIMTLENTSMEESKKANLKNKKHLHTLALEFSYGRTINAEEEEGTLEGLQPHTNLRDLNISYYGGVMFPSWLSDSSLTNLRSIELSQCSNCQSLPQLGKLQLLESLSLEYMDNLNDWSTIGESNLSKLSINHCEKLRALPKLANLKQLDLKLCDEMVMTLEHLPSLERLSISFCSNITSLPESLGTLSALRTLKIEYCSKLGSLPEGLKHLTTLERLEIRFCPFLTERCRDGGEDWNKIAHIRYKSIDEPMW